MEISGFSYPGILFLKFVEGEGLIKKVYSRYGPRVSERSENGSAWTYNPELWNSHRREETKEKIRLG